MTSRDKMPFGKYKDVPLAQVPDDYWDWLEQQDWFKDKWPKLYAWCTVGETEETVSAQERKNINGEAELLAGMSNEFKDFWRRCYGERLRTQGEMLYLAHLRVAVTTWREATKKPVFVPLAKSTPTLPHPLSHIPAPNIKSPSVLEADLGKQKADDTPEF